MRHYVFISEGDTINRRQYKEMFIKEYVMLIIKIYDNNNKIIIKLKKVKSYY